MGRLLPCFNVEANSTETRDMLWFRLVLALASGVVNTGTGVYDALHGLTSFHTNCYRIYFWKLKRSL